MKIEALFTNKAFVTELTFEVKNFIMKTIVIGEIIDFVGSIRAVSTLM